MILVQTINNQVKILTTLLEEICKATTFRPIEIGRKEKILKIIKDQSFIETQE